jgi:hypothetical protein
MRFSSLSEFLRKSKFRQVRKKISKSLLRLTFSDSFHLISLLSTPLPYQSARSCFFISSELNMPLLKGKSTNFHLVRCVCTLMSAISTTRRERGEISCIYKIRLFIYLFTKQYLSLCRFSAFRGSILFTYTYFCMQITSRG